MKWIKRIVITLILFQSFITTVYAEENTFSIIDYSDDQHSVLYSSNTFEEAYSFYLNNIYQYQNLCLFENEKVVLMEYGVLYINSDKDFVTYYSVSEEKEKALSNYSDYDLLYLGESSEQVRFMVSGDVGLINKDEVIYHPYNSHSVSFYDNQNDSLVHHVASSINNYYKYNLAIDVYPEYLDKNTKYYSYDGHLFYDDFYIMCDDYNYGGYSNSLNSETPYYNYYAYLPSRSYTNYSYSEINNFITDTLGITGRLNSYVDFDKDNANDVVNRSEYYGNVKSFLSSEKIYGVNALTSLAWSSEESAFGKSKNAYLNSNVFNHSALIGNEIDNNKYNSVNSSIYSHVSNYVSKKYCDEFSSTYVGSHIGDFISGIASIYSYDPLFADKVVSKAYFYDLALGLKDRNYYTIGITSHGISLYYGPDLSWSFDTISARNNYSFIILEETDDYYKIQCDYAMNQSGEYNPEKCIAYVKKNRVDRVLYGNADNITYNNYKVNIEDKLFNLYSLNEFDILKDFVYKDIEGIEITNYILENDVYIAKTKAIKDITAKFFTYPFTNINGPVIENEKITITYDDGTSDSRNVCGDYIVSCSNDNNSTSIKLNYKGVTKEISLIGNDSFKNEISNIEDGSYSNYSFNDIENIDTSSDLNITNDISTYIRNNNYDLNVSGAYPSFIYHASNIFPEILNTYYFDIKQKDENNSVHDAVSYYGFEFVDGLSFSISRCFYKIDLVSPIVMQVKIPHSNENNVYSVFYKQNNGNIIKVPTQFSENYIKFMAVDDGSYYVYSLNTASSYDVDDVRFLVNEDSNGADYYNVVKEGISLFVTSAFGYLLCALYFILNRRENKNWKDFRKLLQEVESVQEEKQNN